MSSKSGKSVKKRYENQTTNSRRKIVYGKFSKEKGSLGVGLKKKNRKDHTSSKEGDRIDLRIWFQSR